jgi:hypothetical protein
MEIMEIMGSMEVMGVIRRGIERVMGEMYGGGETGTEKVGKKKGKEEGSGRCGLTKKEV